MPIKAVIWDFGGVFTTSPFERFKAFEAEAGLPQDFIRTVNSTNPNDNAWAKFERSDVDIDEFDRLFLDETSRLGHPVQGKSVVALLAGEIRPRMVKALDQIRDRFVCACITNNVRAGSSPGMSTSHENASAVNDVMARFSCIIESSKAGLRKPDPRIYELACERIGVAPDESVYLDDLGINLKPARALGMHTIKVIDPDVALDELGVLLGMELG
jgi:putative hydrolase of the HAD superfamily